MSDRIPGIQLFCHWGKRYGFTYHDKEKHGEIYKSIEFLDNMAFESIKKQNAKEFRDYIDKWKNNLCGNAAPVTVFCSLMELANQKDYKNKIDLVHYTKCNVNINDPKDISVSYAVLIDYI